eukprot:COSAG03_NODE_2295_length_2907_cov_42.529202_5_plen_77_part_00
MLPLQSCVLSSLAHGLTESLVGYSLQRGLSYAHAGGPAVMASVLCATGSEPAAAASAFAISSSSIDMVAVNRHVDI